MLQKITSERYFLHPVLKPIQQPVFRLNKKGCTFLLEDNPLLTLEDINKHHRKNRKIPSVVIDPNFDTEYVSPNNIDMSEVLLSISKKVKNKTRNDIEKLTITNEEIEKYQNERTYKQIVTCQIKGYNPDDITYIYTHQDQIAYMDSMNVKYTINDDGTIEYPDFPSRGVFDYETVIDDKLIKWSRRYENRVSDEDFLLVDWLNQQGYEASLRHEKLSKEDRKEMPTIYFRLYMHFGVVDLPALFKQGTPYHNDLKNAYRWGQITQTRRLMGKSKHDDSCYLNNFILTLEGIDYKVAIKITDTIGLMGGENSKLETYCINTGTPIAKSTISSEEIKNMALTHVLDPYKVHKYGTSDLVMTELLINYAKMMKDPYKSFGIEKGYTPPALTMGKTVKDLFEVYIANFCGYDLEKFISLSEKSKLEYFYDKTYKASASYLSSLVLPDCNAYLLSKCFGGMNRNNRPLINSVTGAFSDKDFDAAYARTMSQFDYPIGNEKIYSFKGVTLGKFLKRKEKELVDNLYLLNIRTPINIILKYPQHFLPSWDKETVRRQKKAKTDTEGYDVTGEVNLDSGYVKTISNKLINTPIISSNIDFIMNELTPRQRKEFLNCEILAAAYYPKNLKVNNFKELEEQQTKHKTKNNKEYKGWQLMNPHDCHSWTSFKLGNVTDNLITLRNMYPKSHPLNSLYKLLNNTLFGDQVSKYFLTSNMIVGNNITGLLRQQMYYSKTSLCMNGAITDGSISNENEALFPKYRIKNPIIEGRVFEYTGLDFKELSQLKHMINDVMIDRVKYSNNYYKLESFTAVLNEEIEQNGFKNFPNSLILKILPAKPVKGEYLNKEKITSIYKLTNKQIYNDDIGHIKPLIGKSKILLDKSGYTIDNKRYSLEEGKKLIEKASTEHPRKVYRNNQLLNGYYFVLQKSTDGIKSYKLQQGLHNIEIKKLLVSVKFQGQSNYHTKDINDVEETTRRGFESIKKKHVAFKFSNSKERIETDDNYYSTESPATKGMKANLKKYPHFPPFVKPQIIKPKAYQKNPNKWTHSTILPGEECLKVGFMRPYSLSMNTFKTDRQRDAWMKADNIMRKQYSYGLELYFLNNDKKTFNIEKMIKTFSKMIDDGVINPRPTLDKSNHINKKIPDWVYENHHTIKLMKLFINDVEMDDFYDCENDDYLDEYYNDNFT
jgi:hypothetical protein